MKYNLLFIIILFISALPLCAQNIYTGIQENDTIKPKVEKSIGVSAAYATEVDNIGVGVRSRYNVTDRIVLVPEVNYFFSKEGTDLWDVNINAHYLFPIRSIKLYVLGGVTSSSWSYDKFSKSQGKIKSTSEINFGINGGGGIQYDFRRFILFAELKYAYVPDFDHMAANIGIAYKF